MERIYQSANGRWIYFDGAEKWFFDTEQEARMAGEQSFEQEYEERVRALWPRIQELCRDLIELAKDDAYNGYGVLVDATPDGELVGASGLRKEVAMRIGGLNGSFGVWFATPDPLLGNTTPEAAIRRRFDR